MIVIKYITLFIITVNFYTIHAYKNNDLTAEISAGQAECFYEAVKAGQILEVEYQVIDGGDLDIDFRINAPGGNRVVQELRKQDGIHTVEPTVDGDYEICFDNTFSRFTKKTVYFEIILDTGFDDELDDEDGEWKQHIVSSEEDFGNDFSALKVAEDKVNQIKNYQSKIIQLQALLRVFEAKDRNIVERNLYRINMWSVINIIVMLTVLSLQVYMVRNMFNDKRKVRT